MGAGSGLKDAYYALEDKWYGFVDSVSERVPAFGSFIDGLEDRGVPSFPAFIVLIIAIIAILAYVFIFSAGAGLTVLVSDSQGNPVEGASVTILLGSEQVQQLETNADGKAVFYLQNGDYTIKVDKENYSTSTQDITVNGSSEADLTISAGETTISKAVYLKSNGALISGSGAVIYSCKGSEEQKTTNYANGKFTAEVKANCTEVEVISIQGYNLVTNTASFAGDSAVTVQQQEIINGRASVTITITGSTAAVPAGLRVRLVPSDGTQPTEQITSGSAVVLFDPIPVKSYYVIVTDPNGNFETYDGSKTSDVKEVKKNELTQFAAQLTSSSASQITVRVKTTAGAAISGAEVRITSLTNENDSQTKITGATGEQAFKVAAGTSYSVTAEHPQYVLGTVMQATAGQTIDLILAPVDSTKSNSILVRVVDPQKSPIENARVILKKVDGSIVSEKTTGATGEAEFFNLELAQTYLATVSKEGFGSTSSGTTQADPQRQKVLEVTFDIGKGTLILKVLDPQKAPIAGATVKAMNIYTAAQESDLALTNSEGVATFTIRADKKIYFVAEASGYQKYFSAPARISANATTEKTIVMQTPSAKLNMGISIYSGNDEVTNADSLTSGATQLSQGVYTVRAVVQVPKGSYSEAGIHLRTGKATEGVTNTMEEDGFYLSAVDSSGKITKGTTYTPSNGKDVDYKPANLTTGNAKWANAVWRNPAEGTYEAEAEITVETDQQNVPLDLWYRGWTKGSSTLRFPAIEPQGQELYWFANKRVLSVGASNLCAGSFCRAYSMQTLTGSDAGRTIYLSGTTAAKKGVTYALTADLTNYSGKAITGAVLLVEGKGIDINSITVNGSEQSLLNAITLGTIGIDAPTKVSVIFTTTASGNSAVRLKINSSTKTELDEQVNFSVKANKKFSLEMVPKVIIPYVDNTLFFEAKETIDSNNGLDGVLISVKSDDDLLGYATTNGEGLAQYTLPQPRIGDNITITAQKEGYDAIDISKTIDAAILTATPPQISETIKVGETKAIATQILLENNTVKNVKVISAQVNGDIRNYLDTTITGLSDTVIESGKDRNYNITMKLNSQGQRVTQPKDVAGNIVINTEAAGTNQGFVTQIPVTIRISMPGYLDNSKCVKIDPATVEFIAGDGEETKVLTIKNTCTAEGTAVALHDLQAKLSEAAKIGSVSISGDGFSNTQLNEAYAKIADLLNANSETQVTLHFVPNPSIASGTQSFTVFLTGTNILNDSSTEKVEAKATLKATTSFLSKCVSVVEPAGGITIDVAPWNMGYQRIASSNLAPYLYNNQSMVNRNSPFGMTYLPNMGLSGYGTAGYGTAYSGYGSFNAYNGGGIGGAADMSYAQSTFVIKNNCTVGIDVQLVPDSRVSVSQDKLSIDADSDSVITVQPGYVLGKYKIEVNAKATGSQATKQNIKNVSVKIRRLGDIDRDCIKTNVTTLSLDSFIYRPEKYSVYNYCYDSGAQISTGNNAVTIDCSAPSPTGYLPSLGTTPGFGGMSAGYGGVPYFQAGMGNYYSGVGYPLGGSYNSYYDYLKPQGIQQNGCSINSCSVITGTRVRYRDLEQGDRGAIERVDFEVMPNPNYLPQRKLFNSQSGTYGAFQSVSDIRTWAAETAARTDIYGNINVSYSNQYGSSECISFPVTISDMWRVGESIDSAINWGDPRAKPADCQDKEALNITEYWTRRDNSNKGAVPDKEFLLNGGNKYIFIANPPAIHIGPSSTTAAISYMPYNMGYFNYAQNDAKNNASSGAKANCGLLDSINVVTKLDPKETGGAVVTVTDIGSGSLLNNSRGSNLAVEIDRSQMTADCVTIDKPITAKVRRAINLESEELTWRLKVVFTKSGKPYTGDPNDCLKSVDVRVAECKDKLRAELTKLGVTSGNADAAKIAQAIETVNKANPYCAQFNSAQTARDILAETAPIQGTALPGCMNAFADYDYSRIAKTTLESYASDKLVDCSKNFCNNDMAKAYLLTNFSKIKELVAGISFSDKGNADDAMLSKLYKQALKDPEIDFCGKGSAIFYSNGDGTYRFSDYPLTKDLLKVNGSDKTESITKMSEASLADMIAVLGNIPAKDLNNVLLQVDENVQLNAQLEELGLVKFNTKLYMSAATYKRLLEVVNQNSDLLNSKVDQEYISVCEPDGTSVAGDTNIRVGALQWIASGHAKLVKGIYDKSNLSEAEIEQIYKGNPNLNAIHTLARFSTKAKQENVNDNNDLLLTNIANPAEDLRQAILSTLPAALQNVKLGYQGNANAALAAIELGSYDAELDYNFVANGNDVNLVLKENNKTALAKKAMLNPLLTSGFNIAVAGDDVKLNESAEGMFVSSTGGTPVLYQRLPVILNTTIYANEALVNYVPQATAALPQQLVNWYAETGSKIGTGQRTSNGYVINVQPKPQAQTIKGVYYYAGDTLILYSGKAGGSITPNALASDFSFKSLGPTTIPNSGQPTTALEFARAELNVKQNVTLQTALAAIKNGYACPVDNAITWNEGKILGKTN